MEQLNQLSIRDQNLKRVYQEICNTKGSSRASVARKLSLSKASLSSLADELIADNLVTEKGKKVKTGLGRNPVMLAPKENTNFIVSVLWKNGYVEGYIIDIASGNAWPSGGDGRLILSVDNPEDYARVALVCAKGLTEKLGSVQRVLGTVMIIPGIVDPVREQILSYPLDITEDIGYQIIQDLIENHSDENICLMNDTAALAYGEKFLNHWEDPDFFYVNFAVGIGSVFYMHGKPLEDATGRQTQFGHIVINPNGPLCECGSRGCLEAMIGEKAVRKRWELIFRESGDMKLGEGNYYRVLREKAENHDIEAVAAMDEIAYVFSWALSNVVTVIYPHRVIIGGSGYELGETFLEKVRSKVQEIGYSYMVRDLQINYSKAEKDIIYKAGAQYAFDTHYNFALKSIQGLHLG